MAKHDSIPSVNIPAPLGRPGGLAEKIENVGKRLVAGAFDLVKDSLAHVLRLGLQAFLEAIEPELADMYGPLLRDIANEPDTPESLRHAINVALSGKYEGGAAALGALGQQAGSAVMGNVLGIALSGLSYTLARKFNPFRLDFATGWAIKKLRPQDAAMWFTDLRDQGWSEARIMAADDAMQRRLGPDELGQLLLRGAISDDDYNDRMNQLGIEGYSRGAIKFLLQQIPGPGDLISMAVREAWNEEFARLGQTDSEFPPELAEWGAKQGLSAEWTRRYWRAHWNLPSVQMGMEMLHRDVITEDQLMSLIKAQDVSPFWRDKLTAISYNVPTRVDVRRAYKDQVISEADVKRAYLDFGYNEKWAEILTRWTVVAYAPEEKDITIADVRGALERGTMSEAETTEALQSLDVSDEAIAFYIAQARFKRAEALKTKRISAIESKFVAGKLDRSGAASALTSLSLPGSEIEIYLDAWQAEREAKTREPTFGDLRGFYLDDLIAPDAFQAELKKLGYDTDDIALYVRSADADKERAAKTETQRAQNEQERLAKAEKATSYQIAVIAIDSQLAQQRQAIANAQAALNAGLSDKQRRDAEDAIDQLSAQIAAERKTIATFRAQSAGAKRTLNEKISEALRDSLDAQIAASQTAIAEFGQQIAALSTEIAQAKLDMLTAESDEEKSSLKSHVAEMQVEIAQVRESVEAEQLAITNARNQLRLHISDDERIALEATIRDADEAISKSSASIADYQAQQATLKMQISVALNTDQRATLAIAIDDARKRIAELQVERASARVEA